MDDQELENLEPDPRFPSGAWTGFYLQYWLPGRHATNLQLSFSEGKLSGEGKDQVGRYTVDGGYDLETGQCQWTKQYIGRHCIAYKGTNEGHGIWGVYELNQLWGLLTDRGGFHIWPEGFDAADAADAADESDEIEKTLLEVMRSQSGNRTLRFVFAGFLIVIIAIAVGLGFLLKIFWKP
ncbi:MAG TPA: hypothetical protein VMJ32_05025 [Pirellulales bacterium]|nr:hypothetical protein [Pirellulales bacterium]